MEKTSTCPYLIIVPTYNELANIKPLLSLIFAARDDVDVLFVDDRSADGTAAAIKAAAQEHAGRIHLLERAGKLGLGTAYVAGFRWALERPYQAIFEMDADLSHNPAYLSTFIALLAHHDVVVGSRYVPGGGTRNWSALRRGISRAGSLYGRMLLGLKVADLTGGYNAWRREVLTGIDLGGIHSDGYCFQIELKYRALLAGFSLVESPIVFEDRRAGHSKMSFGIVAEAILRVATLRKLRRQHGVHEPRRLEDPAGR